MRKKSFDGLHISLEPYNLIPLANHYNPHFYINVSKDTSLSRMPGVVDSTLHNFKDVKIKDKTPISLECR